jgi:hypothetical protein
MPSDFTLALKEWQLFFSTVALASVTLAGLLFVSLSLRFDRLSSDSYAGMMKLARQSFSDFLYVLLPCSSWQPHGLREWCGEDPQTREKARPLKQGR